MRQASKVIPPYYEPHHDETIDSFFAGGYDGKSPTDGEFDARTLSQRHNEEAR